MIDKDHEEVIREIDRILSLPKKEREKILEGKLDRAVKGQRRR